MKGPVKKYLRIIVNIFWLGTEYFRNCVYYIRVVHAIAETKGVIVMKNLSAEMARYGVSNNDIQTLLSCTDKTVRNKLNGVSEFSVGEALKIRDVFFPGLRIEYLFSQSDQPAPRK